MIEGGIDLDYITLCWLNTLGLNKSLVAKHWIWQRENEILSRPWFNLNKDASV